MVLPIVGSLSNPIAAGASLPEAGRPLPQADAARQVTPPQHTFDSNRTSARQQGDLPQEGDLPASSLEKTLEQLNKNMEAWSTGMRFTMDPEAQRLIVSIVDNATGDVLRTVPSDAVLRVAKMIVQLQGKMVDTKV